MATAVIPDFPNPGVNFIDITTVLKNPDMNQLMFETVRDLYDPDSYDIILSPGARGWLLAQPMALALRKPFIPIRKEGKLPRKTVQVESENEYASKVILEAHADDIPPGSKVLIVDDALATLGTVAASCKLANILKAEVVGALGAYDLLYLSRVEVPCPIRSIVPYEEPPAPRDPDKQ